VKNSGDLGGFLALFQCSFLCIIPSINKQHARAARNTCFVFYRLVLNTEKASTTTLEMAVIARKLVKFNVTHVQKLLQNASSGCNTTKWV